MAAVALAAVAINSKNDEQSDAQAIEIGGYKDEGNPSAIRLGEQSSSYERQDADRTDGLGVIRL